VPTRPQRPHSAASNSSEWPAGPSQLVQELSLDRRLPCDFARLDRTVRFHSETPAIYLKLLCPWDMPNGYQEF